MTKIPQESIITEFERLKQELEALQTAMQKRESEIAAKNTTIQNLFQELQQPHQDHKQLLFFQSILGHINVPVFVKNRIHQWVYINQAYLELIGKVETEILGKTDYDIFPKDQAEIFWKKEEDILIKNDSSDENILLSNSDGAVLNVRLNYRFLKGPEGRSYLLGTIYDNTSLNQSEIQNLLLEERLKTIFNQIKAGVILANDDNEIIDCNQEILAILAIEKQHFIGKNLFDFIHSEHIEREKKLIKELRTGQIKEYEIEEKIQDKNGYFRWMLASAVLFYDFVFKKDLRLITLIDINDRKNAEQELIAHKELIEMATQATQVGIWEWNFRTHQPLWHKNFFEMLGLMPNSYDGDGLGALRALVPETDFKRLNEAFEQIEANLMDEIDLEYHIKDAGGELKTMLLRGKVIKDSQEIPTRLVGTSTDISVLKNYERKTRQLLLHFRKANARLLEQQKVIAQNIEEVTRLNEMLNTSNADLERLNRDFSDSITYAQRIQKAILPLQDVIAQTLPEHFILYRPKDIVSGDFYWYAEKPYKAIIAAVDCTGHGVPGAFMSLIGNDLLHEIVEVRNITEPNRILDELRREINRVLKQEITGNMDGMDISVCVIDRFPEEHRALLGQPKLEFAAAGNPLFYIQNNQLNTLRADKIIIGGYEFFHQEDNFTKHTIDISSSTMFYIYSDGYRDQHGGADGKRFSAHRFKDLLLSIHHLPVYEQKQILDKTIIDWMGNEQPQTDDILVIGVRV
jgi:PAS domain S-box-containing protein